MNGLHVGIRGVCAHCHTLLELAPWQLNALAMNEPFACEGCRKALQLSCPRQIKHFQSLDALAMLQPSMGLLMATTLVVALMAHWRGLISAIELINLLLIAVFSYSATLGYVRKKRRVTLVLHSINGVRAPS